MTNIQKVNETVRFPSEEEKIDFLKETAELQKSFKEQVEQNRFMDED